MEDQVKRIEELESQLLEAQKLLKKSNQKGMQLSNQVTQMKIAMDQVEYLPDEWKAERAKMAFQLEMASNFVASGAFPNYTPQQCYVLMKAGEEIGLKPMESLNDLYIVKGGVGFMRQGLTKRFYKYGYRMEYKNETDKGVLVVVTDCEDPEEKYEYEVTVNEKSLQKSKAMEYAPKEKMRYHGLRMIAKFKIPFILGGVLAGDEVELDNGVMIEPQELNAIEAPKEDNNIFEKVAQEVSKDINNEINPDTPKEKEITPTAIKKAF